MAFPVSRRGSIDLAGPLTREAAMRELERRLVEAGATDVRADAESLRFHVPWTVSWGPLWFSDGGAVVATPTATTLRLEFTLSSRRSALLAAALAYGWLAGPGMAGAPLLVRAAVGTAAFLWLFGLWYLVLPFRFRRLLRGMSTQAPVAAAAT